MMSAELFVDAIACLFGTNNFFIGKLVIFLKKSEKNYGVVEFMHGFFAVISFRKLYKT